MFNLKGWLAECLQAYADDPADSDHQAGYLACAQELDKLVKEAGTKVRLYCELHVTVEPFGSWDEFKEFMDRLNWRASRFDEDLVDNYSGKWFISQRAEDQIECGPMLAGIVGHLVNANYTVLRWKAEDTLLDSKYGDTL